MFTPEIQQLIDSGAITEAQAQAAMAAGGGTALLPGMSPQEGQVLNAVMRQQGAVPQGPPTNIPNFSAQFPNSSFNPNVLSNEGVMPPVSGVSPEST